MEDIIAAIVELHTDLTYVRDMSNDDHIAAAELLLATARLLEPSS